MKVELARLLQQNLPAPGLQCVFLTGSNESYLDDCRRDFVKLYTSQCPHATVEKLAPETLLKEPEKAQPQRDLFAKSASRLLIVEDPGDLLTPFMTAFLKQAPQDVTLILSSAISSKAKKLKALCQAAPNCAYVSCYLSAPHEKKRYLEALLKEHSLQFDADAAAYAFHILESTPEVLRENCLKLSLYKTDGTPVSLADFKACDARSGEVQLDALAAAIGNRSIAAAFATYQQVQKADFEDVHVLRSLSGHFAKLLDLKAKTAEGMSAQQAMNAMRPPIFFKSHDMFKSHLQKWEAPEIMKALQILRRAELNLKTGRPAGFMMELAGLISDS